MGWVRVGVRYVGQMFGGREQIPQLLGHGDDGRAERGAGGS